MRSLAPGDVETLCSNLREADAAEVVAGGEATGADGVRYAVSVSTMAWALDLDGQLGGIGGLMRVGAGQWALWLLTTHFFGEHPRPFLRCIRRALPELRTFGQLFNFIDGRYTGALRLAAALGASFESPINRNGHVFVPFSFGRL